MATQLTRRGFLSSLSGDAPVMSVPTHVMVALAAGCVAVVYASLFAAIYAARRDERMAERLYSDTLTLTEAPAPDLDVLAAELAAAQARLAQAEALAAPATIDPASDEATALLVRRAQAAGLAVIAVTRVDASPFKSGENLYDVQAIRLTLQGPPAQLIDYLFRLHQSDPALIATLTSLTTGATGVAQAEIVFSVYTNAASPTPQAGAAQ
jgi:hypothetical protein